MPETHTRADTVDYVAKIIKAKPDSEYGDVVKAGKAAGYHVYPLIMGLAKNKLGMGHAKAKRGPGRPRGRRPGRPVGSTLARRGRPPMNGRGLTADLVRGVARMQADVADMRDALRQIAKLSARF
jgi:hypothetical protein